jgi:hypothetical protein
MQIGAGAREESQAVIGGHFVSRQRLLENRRDFRARGGDSSLERDVVLSDLSYFVDQHSGTPISSARRRTGSANAASRKPGCRTYSA